MTLLKIIKIANAAYPDGLILQAFKAQQHLRPTSVIRYTSEEIGDGLAWFIALELKETYDSKAGTKAQLEEAHRVIHRATEELETVSRKLYEALCTGRKK